MVSGAITVAKAGVGVRALAGRTERGIPEVLERGAACQGSCIRRSNRDGNCARHHLVLASQGGSEDSPVYVRAFASGTDLIHHLIYGGWMKVVSPGGGSAVFLKLIIIASGHNGVFQSLGTQ